MLLENKVALITGAAAGIGRASALRLAGEGAKVALSDVNLEGVEETAHMVKTQTGSEAIAVKCDVSNTEQVENFVNETIKAFGALHIGLNNAGVGGMMLNVDKVEEDTYNLVMDVNVKGVWLCMKYEIPHIIQAGGGAIVNIASIAGLLGFRGNAIYSASKHAVVGMTKSVALEYARLGMRVNAVCPGFTETAMVTDMVTEVPRMEQAVNNASPMRRLGHVDEIADAVLYLASDMSSFVNGQALAIDGGTSSM